MSDGLIVDLFAGPGGWDEGARQLGATNILGLEYDGAACETRYAAGHKTWQQDIGAVTDQQILATGEWAAPHGGVVGLIGSPPCPAFSLAGNRDGWEDIAFLEHHILSCRDGWVAPPADHEWGSPLSRLTLEPLRWALLLDPEWVALEQVPPVLPLWRKYQPVLEARGYHVWTGVLNSADYGVPQTRQRAVLMASKRHHLFAPATTHNEKGTGGKDRWVTMAQALGWTSGRVGFPRADDLGTSPDGYRERDWRGVDEPAFAVTEKARSWIRDTEAPKPAESHVLQPGTPYGPDGHRRTYDPQVEPAPTTVFGHDASGWRWVPVEERVLNTGRAWKKGGTRDDAQTIDPLAHPAPTVTAESGMQWQMRERVAEAVPIPEGAEWTEGRPATTIAGDSRCWPPGHKVNADDRRRLGEDAANARYGDRAGSEAIRLTVPQALVLQSFPPDYPVQGTRSKQFQQVGNAVPPGLALVVLRDVIFGPPPPVERELIPIGVAGDVEEQSLF